LRDELDLLFGEAEAGMRLIFVFSVLKEGTLSCLYTRAMSLA